MGFSNKVQDLVYPSISDIQYKVGINGETSSEFRSTREVRQGDPLSPLLFIMAQQMFSFNLKKMERTGGLQPYKLGRNIQPISHLLFADDMLVFSNGRIRSLRTLRDLLQRYERSSGQQINLEKSSIFVSKYINGRKLARIQNLLGCKIKEFPFTYLGAPLYKGRCKEVYFERLIQIMCSKLEGWKANFLSFAGKITLIKSVLASIPIHTLSCLTVPKTVTRRMEDMMKGFLWSQHGTKRTHWVAWEKVCAPCSEGGLGFRSLKDTILGLQGKLAWKVFAGDTLWTRHLRQKYRINCYMEACSRTQSASRLWRQLYPHFQQFQDLGRWNIGKGHVSFWKSNWLGTILDRTNSSNITVREGLGELEKWRPALTEDQWIRASLVYIDEQVDDKLVCTLTPTGKFSVPLYIQTLRANRPKKN